MSREHVSVQSAFGVEQGFAQQGQIAAAVEVVEKAGQGVVATLHDVLRNVWQVESWKACHEEMMRS